MRILLVEDNPGLAEWLAKALENDRYTVDCIKDGDHADQALRTESYDLVLLDLSLPRLSGHDILKRLRQRGNKVPVLVLTANTSLQARVSSLDFGADDYLAKPFELAELEARMRALLRRANDQAMPVIQCGNLSLDSRTRIFSIADRELALTPREHAVLEALIMKMGRTMSKDALAASLYTLDDDASSDAIEIYIHRVRKKIEASNAVIITLRGLGYMLKQRDEP
ncbi:MAG: response regulator [Burkholderiales bacterium]|nr:response regulator [Burkholderiales bacterium]